MAVLVLEDAVPLGLAARLRHPLPGDLVGSKWWSFGFPDQMMLGNSSDGLVGESLGYGWVRLDTGSRYPVKNGYSGAALWSHTYQAVVGIVGRARETDGDAQALTLNEADHCLPGQKLHLLTEWSAEAAGESALAAWGWSLERDPEAGRHWRPRARGVSTEAEQGFRFRGRTAALKDIVSWIAGETVSRQVLVVTGSPGVGKSAVLGRVVTAAHPAIAKMLPCDDDTVCVPLGAVACAVHAKGKTALEVAREVARAASAPMPEVVADLAPAVRGVLEDGPARRFAIVIDALDEASTPADARTIVTKIALPLVETCTELGVRIVVGSRPRDDAGDLLAGFGSGAQVLDLDQPQYFAQADLAAYAMVSLQLQGDERADNPYQNEEIAGPVAARIATLAEGNFLVAGLIARAHGLHDERLVVADLISFTPTVEAALRDYLQRLPDVDGVSATVALTALAYAEAPGLPLALWRACITALSGTTLPETRLHAFARSSAANFLVEASGTDSEPGTFRLFHQALNDALLKAHAETGSPTDTERALARALTAEGRSANWHAAPAYLLRSLPRHAARGRVIDDLLTDDTYLLHADLRRLIPAAAYATSRLGHQRARLIRKTPRALDAGPHLRAALFSLTESRDHLGDAYRTIRLATPYRALWAVNGPRQEETILEAGTGSVTAVCGVSTEDGRTFLASGGSDGAVRLWDPVTGDLLRTLEGRPSTIREDGTSSVTAVCGVSTEDGRTFLASGGSDGAVRLWDPVTGDLLRTLEGRPSTIREDGTGSVTAVCEVPTEDGRTLLAIGSLLGTVRLWDPTSNDVFHILENRASSVNAVCVVYAENDRPLLAVGGFRGMVQLWDPITGDLLRTLQGHTGRVTVCTISTGDGRTLLVGGGGDLINGIGEVWLWDPATGNLLRTLEGHTGPVGAVCGVPTEDGRTLLASSSDHKVWLWDPATGNLLRTLEGHASWVNALCALPTGDGHALLASGSNDRTARLWDPTTRKPLRGLERDAYWVNGVCALSTRDGRILLASGSADSTVRMWDPTTGKLIRALEGHADSVNAVCAVPIGRGRILLASGSADSTVRMWDPTTGKLLRALEGHADSVNAVCAVPIGRGRILLASGSADSTVRMWDPTTGKLIRTLNGHTNLVRAVCAVQIGRERVLLASGSGDGTVRLWDPTTGKLIRTLKGHTSWVNAVCAVQIGRERVLLASGSGDGTVRLWDPIAGKLLRTLKGHTGLVNAVCAVQAEDGRTFLVSGSYDRTVRFWDPESGRLVFQILNAFVSGVVTIGESQLIVASTEGLLALAFYP